MAFNTKNPRSRKLKKLSSSIAKFAMEDTQESETAAHKHLYAAVKSLEFAANELVKNDNESAEMANRKPD